MNDVGRGFNLTNDEIRVMIEWMVKALLRSRKIKMRADEIHDQRKYGPLEPYEKGFMHGLLEAYAIMNVESPYQGLSDIRNLLMKIRRKHNKVLNQWIDDSRDGIKL